MLRFFFFKIIIVTKCKVILLWYNVKVHRLGVLCMANVQVNTLRT